MKRQTEDLPENESKPAALRGALQAAGLLLVPVAIEGALLYLRAPTHNVGALPWALGVGSTGALGAGALVFQLERRLRRSGERRRQDMQQLSAEREAAQSRERRLSLLVDIERLLLEDADGNVQQTVLGRLGALCGASRACLFSVYNDPKTDELLARQRVEWCGSGTVASGDGNDGPTLSLATQFRRWFDAMSRGDVLNEGTSGATGVERTFWEGRGAQSFLAMPLQVRDQFSGFLLIESRRTRPLDDAEIATVRMAADAIVFAEARRGLERATLQQAHHDALTGLPNRRKLHEELEKALETARNRRAAVAVLYLDLDRFKQINDSLGHAFGDRFLQYVVRHRLQPCLGRRDLLARVGGDEFVLLISDLDHPDIVTGAEQKADAILRSLSLPISLEGQELAVSTSIGISRYPTDGADADSLLKHADVAMYNAKQEGRSKYRFFTASMNAATRERFQMETDLRHDLDPRNAQPGTFVLFYQPQVDLSSGNMIGVESLARWRHSKRGLVTPDRFVPLAEETGLILPLGELVLRSACQQAALWCAAGVSLRIAVNLSARQMRDRDLPVLVARVLKETGLPPTLLDLELTETSLLADIPGALGTMNELKQMGVRLSLDDFGAGYSSLSHLRACPFDTVKIDRLFVRAIVGGVRDQMLVKALIQLAHAIGMEVVAEGVETMAQRDILMTLGCRIMQGYLFSPPVAADDLERLFLSSSMQRAA